MALRARPRRFARVARLMALSLVAIGVAACAAILGIDDREPVDGAPQNNEGGDAPIATDGAADGAIADAASDVKDPTKVCADAACGDAGGTCINGSCALSCGAGCNGKTFTCPPDTDCTIGCTATDSCDAVKCVGGRSCTFDCGGVASCKGGVSCASERCEFRCRATADACKDGVVTCDASVCNILCSGPTSCNKGAQANAGTYCGIACTGVESCKGAAANLTCIAPDASIFCGQGKDICAENKPSCFGDYCVIACKEPAKCTGKNYCCDSVTCAFDAAPFGENDCP